MYEIEKNVDLPSPATARAKYPWDNMEVGDSFVISEEDKSIEALLVRGRAAVAKRNGLGKGRFTSRKNPRGEGVRVWRIS